MFIDSTIQEYETLIDDLTELTEVIILDSQRDGIVQITESLQQYDDLDAIHIVSHGGVGELSLGNTKLNSNTLNNYADELISWQDSIADDGDILLYGCNVGASTTGKEFVEDLSQYTAADVLASIDLTGSENLGGDWDLEYSTGDIEESLAFDADVKRNYQFTLNDVFLNDIRIYKNGTVFPQLPADIRVNDNGDIINPDSSFLIESVYIRLDAAFNAPNVSLNEPAIDLPSNLGSSDVEFGDLRIDYIPTDLTLVDPLSDPALDLSLFRFNKVENQPFSLNFDNGNFAFRPSGYEYDNTDINSFIFPFDANSLNFNPTNFEFTSVSINEIGPVDPDRNSISFKFDEGTFDFSSLTPRDLIGFKFDGDAFDYYDIEADNTVRFGDNLSFDATAVTFRSDSITFDYRPSTLNFNPGAFAANANLYEYKLSAADFDAGVSLEQFNASDYRALDYAFAGDELFDSQYYSNTNILPEGMNPFTDYSENGYRAGRNPNGLFFVDYYLNNNTDVRDDGMDPLKHFALFGNTENFNFRDPNPFFDSSYYNAKNPRVAEEGMNSLWHYINFGWKESRINNPGGFNPNRDPSPFFDTSYYFDKHTDVLNASYTSDSANPVQHALEFGINGLYANEERITHPLFESEYVATFTTFIDSNSEGFEAVQNEINDNENGLEISPGENGEVLVASLTDPIPKPIEGLFYFFVGTVSYVLSEGFREAVFEGLKYSNFGIIQGDVGDIKIGTEPFPEPTEGTPIVTTFPRNTTAEDIINSGDANIFFTPLEPLQDISSSQRVFPQRDEILEDLLNDGLFLGGEEIEQGSYFLAAGREGNIIGGLREQAVADLLGVELIKDANGQDIPLFEPGASEPVAIDVFGPNGELILVGGPNKVVNRSKLGQRVKDLKIIADVRGVKAQYYFSDNTPQSAIDLAKKRLCMKCIFF